MLEAYKAAGDKELGVSFRLFEHRADCLDLRPAEAGGSLFSLIAHM